MAEKKTEAKAAAAAPVLLPASESSDQQVHTLLAERQAAVMTGDDKAAKDVTAKLAELGYR